MTMTVTWSVITRVSKFGERNGSLKATKGMKGGTNVMTNAAPLPEGNCYFIALLVLASINLFPRTFLLLR